MGDFSSHDLQIRQGFFEFRDAGIRDLCHFDIQLRQICEFPKFNDSTVSDSGSPEIETGEIS